MEAPCENVFLGVIQPTAPLFSSALRCESTSSKCQQEPGSHPESPNAATLYHRDFNSLLHRMPLAQAIYHCLRHYCVNYHCKHQLKKMKQIRLQNDACGRKRKERFSFLGSVSLSRALIQKTFGRKQLWSLALQGPKHHHLSSKLSNKP